MKTNFTSLIASILFAVIISTGIQAQNPNWLTSGNNGTNPNNHFLGTTDNKALVFRTNNVARVHIANTGNVGIGTLAPTAKLEVAGGDAIINGITIGRGQGAIGTNTAAGDHALFSNTTGFQNTAFGSQVLISNTTGGLNTGGGFGALYNNTTGASNTAYGMNSLLYNTIGGGNTATGIFSLASNTTGSYNTANGYSSLVRNTTGNYNFAGGIFSLNANTTGSYNTALGYQSFKTGEDFSNSTAIGANAAITASNQVSLGDANITSLYCKGAYSAATTLAPNMYVSPSGQIMRSTLELSGGGWSLKGNAGTIDGTNFIGTTDNVPFNIRVNNQKAGRIETEPNTGNTFYGYVSGNSNTTGFYGTAMGFRALFSNTSGSENTAVGTYTLSANTTGWYNTAIGWGALTSSISGYDNTALGQGVMFFTTTGERNTGSGNNSLIFNTTGSHNTGSGVYSLRSNTTGNNNTALGAWADVSSGNFSNATAIGSNAVVNNSNKVRIGDNNVTVVESAAGSWTTSDGRFKTNIKEEVKGLEFIKLLRPVVYNFDANKFEAFLTQGYPDSIKAIRKEMMNKSTSKISGICQTGLIAQEVEIAAKKSGYNFNGVHVPENPIDNYSISYEKLVVPLVKAVQELSNENEALKARLDKIEQMLIAKSTTFENISNARLEQNAPNPFNGNTVINYYVPINSGTAALKITDVKGSLLKTFILKEGRGQVILQSGQLAAGTYMYSLIINQRHIDTKQMILIK